MKRMIPVALLSLTLAVGGLAVAGGGHSPDPDRMVEALTERLGLEAGAADEVSGILMDAHTEGQSLRLAARDQAQALKTALDAGDEAAMLDAMAQLDGIKAEAEALKADTRAELEARLTVEQRAKLTLFHLRRKAMEHGRH